MPRRKGSHLSPEHRAKISAANTGRVKSDVTRRKLSESKRGRALSEETRQKISAALKGRPMPSRKGISVSPETRAKMSAAHKGKVLSEEHKQKISAAIKNKSRVRGWHHSEEAKAKLSAAMKGRPWAGTPKQRAALAILHERMRAGEWVLSSIGGPRDPISPETRAKMSAVYQNRPAEVKAEIGRKISSTRIHRNIANEPDRGIEHGLGCKRILILHHNQMKDDPERLTTEFLADLTGCDCPKTTPKQNGGD